MCPPCLYKTLQIKRPTDKVTIDDCRYVNETLNFIKMMNEVLF